jgi:hypothetical protein
MTVEQASLFSAAELSDYQSSAQSDALAISQTALQDWKQRIFDYQQQVRITEPMEQGSLFEMSAPQQQADEINPFTLPQQNTQFWRWKASDTGVAALYFVVDYELPLLLYVGETVKSNQRWKGEHDCKRYLLNYRQAHYQHQLPSALGIAFWSQAPTETKSRQRLESDLIFRWRSPFNKENWKFWSTPFTSGK